SRCEEQCCLFHSLHRHMTRSDVVDGIIDLERADTVVLTTAWYGVICIDIITIADNRRHHNIGSTPTPTRALHCSHGSCLVHVHSCLPDSQLGTKICFASESRPKPRTRGKHQLGYRSNP
ncbi:hypothetical protein H100_05405, partial [Trichophyton rubrum MR850]